MSDDTHLVRLALERGWVTREQLHSGRPLKELLSPSQIEELREDRGLAAKVLQGGLLSSTDVVEKPSETFGRYRIVRVLGEGGSGRVYLARDPELGREVAIKILDRGVTRQLDRFRREMEILATLRHPNIVSIYDAGTQDGRPYFAMEFASGRSLAEEKPPLRRTVEILEQVARACQAAHEKGVVHRDLKPANILLADRPMVADFGIAKIQDETLTETGFAIGTPHYMSPEQARGEAIDPRSDVYSLGVILYEVLTGRLPFEGTSVVEITRRVVDDEPTTPRKIEPHAPRDLETVALKAMAKEPGRRYASAGELAADLAAWLDGRPVSARRAGRLERLIVAARRKPKLFAAYAATAVLSLTVLVLLLAEGPTWSGTATAQQEIVEEALKIQRWESNLYRRAQEIPYEQLEESVGALERVLRREGLPPVLRHQAHSAIARASLNLGRIPEARRHLDAAINHGHGQQIGEDYFERARLSWEELVRQMVTKNQERAKRLLDRVRWDLRAGLDAGFQDDWYRKFAQSVLEVVEKGKDLSDEHLMALQRLGDARGNPVEETAKALGDVFLILKRPDDAIPQFKRAVAGRECYVQAYNGLAMAYAMKGEGPEHLRPAFDVASRAIDINPRYEGSYFLFAVLCRQALLQSPRLLGREDEEALNLLVRAIEKLRKGSRVRPDSEAIQLAHGTACVFYGFLLAAREENPEPAVAEAVRALRQASEINDRAFEPWLALGMAHMLVAMWDTTGTDSLQEAERCFEEARQRAPRNAAVWSWIGHRHALDLRYERALAAWNRAIEIQPSRRDDLEEDIRDVQRRR